jgi:WD40 repeat protein
VNAVAFSPASDLLASGADDKTVLIRRLPSCKEVARLTDHTYLVLCAAFSPNGELVASGSADKTVCVYRVSDILAGNTKHCKKVRNRAAVVISVCVSDTDDLLAARRARRRGDVGGVQPG